MSIYLLRSAIHVIPFGIKRILLIAWSYRRLFLVTMDSPNSSPPDIVGTSNSPPSMVRSPEPPSYVGQLLADAPAPDVRELCYRQVHLFRFTNDIFYKVQDAQQKLSRLQYAFGNLVLYSDALRTTCYCAWIDNYHHRLQMLLTELLIVQSHLYQGRTSVHMLFLLVCSSKISSFSSIMSY